MEDDSKKIILHACCAPCLTASVESLESINISSLIFWYNPNIEPFPEHEKRYETLKKYLNKKGVSDLLITKEYDYLRENAKWHQYIEGFEAELEGGARCKKCIEFRLKEAAKIGEKMKLRFSTTLPISPHKNSMMIKEIGEKISEGFIFFDFKKQDGYKKSVELSNYFDLYRQNYCGCQYSNNNGKVTNRAKKDCS